MINVGIIQSGMKRSCHIRHMGKPGRVYDRRCRFLTAVLNAKKQIDSSVLQDESSFI